MTIVSIVYLCVTCNFKFDTMRPLFFVFLILSVFTFRGLSQEIRFPVDTVTGEIKFTEVVYVDSISKLLLYSRAREWFTKAFKSSKAVLDLDDKENGKLIGKGNFTAITEES